MAHTYARLARQEENKGGGVLHRMARRQSPGDYSRDC